MDVEIAEAVNLATKNRIQQRHHWWETKLFEKMIQRGGRYVNVGVKI